ncbi:LysR family transcriptional regulator [Rhodobacteraceae bacterium DSL-40]|uniref:LysR family transcriptional regulator n=1 Tax=Amaricoccus sp. B4 TaxID=3368557 RepID=UPI000DAF1359
MIDKLEMFIALATEEHFGKAAEACGVTQPTLSSAIKQLEEHLGVTLVMRGSRYRGLTPEGKRVLDWARRIVGDTRTMREEIRATRLGLSGNLRLAVIPTALTTVSRLTASFARAHPNVRFTILSRNSGEILELLDNLRIDAGITYLDNEPLGRVVTVPLYSERYVLVVRKGEPLADRQSVAWSELGSLPLCLLTPDMQNRRIIARHLHENGNPVVPAVETNSVIVLVSHVLQGDWATILPLKAADIFLADAPLAAIPIGEPDALQAVGFIAPEREPRSPVLRTLLQMARRMADD